MPRRFTPFHSRRPRVTRHRLGVVGAVMVEYAFLLVAVGIPTMVGLTMGGQRLYRGYVNGRDAMLRPYP